MSRIVIIFISLFLSTTMCVITTGFAQTNWDKYSDNPVLTEGPPGAWDENGVIAHGMLFDGFTYHMWYTGFDISWNVRLGYATSTDATTWTKYASNPVLDAGAQGTWDQSGPGSPSIIFDSTTYHMWYDATDNSNNIRIGYATSPDRVTWTKYGANPVLDIGSPGEWDDEGVFNPMVIIDSTTYHMWYGGWDSLDVRIGYATSSDGITWTKYGGNPILDLGSPGSWDDAAISGPSVIFDGATYHMWYGGGDSINVGTPFTYDGSIGYSSSPDGVTWTKFVDNPVLVAGSLGTWDEFKVLIPEVIYEDSTYHMWYNGLNNNSFPFRIGYAVDSRTTTPPQPDFWEPVNSSPGGTISVFAFNASGDIFAGGSGVHRSMDNGNSWTFLGNVLGNQGIRDLVINTSGTIFAATDRTVYSSTDNGDNWTFHLIAAFDGIDVISLATNSKGDVFAGMRSDGMFRSTDNGNTWTEIRPREEIFDIVVNANDDIFIGTRSRVLRSTDNGSSWVSAGGGINRPEVLALGVNSNNDLFAYVLGDGLVRSTDSGENWSGVLDGNVGVFSAFAFNSEGHVFAGGCVRCTPIPGAYRSTDNGENWTEINGGLASLNVATLAIGNDDQIFAGTPEGVFRGVELTTAVDELAASISSFFTLEQNYPNPFNPETNILYQLIRPEHVVLKIYNTLGQEIVTLVDERKSTGHFSARWDGKDRHGMQVPSGLYFYRIQAGNFVDTRKMLIVR